MNAWMRGALALALPVALVAAGASAAHADATIDGDGLTAAVQRGTRFIVQADVTMSNPGTVTLAGVVGETPFEFTKRFKTKSGKTRTKTMKFVVDPARLRIRDAQDTLLLQAQMSASESDQSEPAVSFGGAALPPPLVVVPGTGNELSKGAYQPFVDALNANAGSPWITKGRRATAVVYHYNSLSIDASSRNSLEAFGQQIAKKANKLNKKSKTFDAINIIGHSLGGVVIRQAMVPSGTGAKASATLAGTVRHAFFMGAPQSGTPIAYLAERAILAGQAAGVDPKDLAGDLVNGVDNPSAGGLADLLLDENFIGIVRVFIPTYAFADVPGNDQVDRVGVFELSGGTETARLADLNAVNPDPSTSYHAIHYSSVAGATGEVQNVSAIDLFAFLAGGGTNLGLIELLDGPGDGVAPQDSTLMTSHPNWNQVLRPMNLGPGSHSPTAPTPGAGNGYLADPNCIGYILQQIFGLDT